MGVPLIYSFRSVAIRKGSSSMAVGGIALVVIVFAVLLALAEGFRKAVASTGSPRHIMVIRKGADAELQSQLQRDHARIIEELPMVARNAKGVPLAVQETVIILQRAKQSGGTTNMTVRGTQPNADQVHVGLKLTEGRWFNPGSGEAIVGLGLARRMKNMQLGDEMPAGKFSFKIVGIFEAGGSALESECWADLEVVQAVFHRGNIVQSMLFQAAGDPQQSVKDLEKFMENDPRLRTQQAIIETAYYKKQSELLAAVITILGGILTMIMAVGAVAGAMNTMYAAVSSRQREIGCLLSMGFTPASIWIAFILESLILSLIGAALGCAIGWFMFHGMKTGTTNWATFSETAFEFSFTPEIMIKATVLALSMGFIGGFLPAVQAARMKVVDALRRA